jgi:hypothetical protein
MQRIKAQDARERHMLESRKQAIAEFRGCNAWKRVEMQRRFALSQEKERQRTRERQAELQQREVDAQLRIAKLARERERFVEEQRAKLAEHIEQYLGAVEEMRAENERRRKELEERNTAIEERLIQQRNARDEQLRPNSLTKIGRTHV